MDRGVKIYGELRLTHLYTKSQKYLNDLTSQKQNMGLQLLSKGQGP